MGRIAQHPILEVVIPRDEELKSCGPTTLQRTPHDNALKVVAGFALTINKAQGLTVEEGVVIHLVGGKRFRPASKHGLPFVAFTRSQSFAMTAFKNIPPWQDFVKGKESGMLRMRLAFTEKLSRLHRQTLARHSHMKTAELEQEAHEVWLAEQSTKTKRRKKTGPFMPCPACGA